jgi:hypothetical protein
LIWIEVANTWVEMHRIPYKNFHQSLVQEKFCLVFTIGIGGDSQNAGPDIQNVVGLGLGQTVQQPRAIPTQVPRPGLPNSCQFSFRFSPLS